MGEGYGRPKEGEVNRSIRGKQTDEYGRSEEEYGRAEGAEPIDR